MQNVDLIKSLYSAFAARDLAQLKQLCHEDILWQQNPGFPGGGVHTGIESIIENVFDANTRRWESFQFKAEKITDLGETVLVEGHYRVKSQQAQQAVNAQAAHVFTLQNHQVKTFQQYTDTKVLWDNYEGK